MKRFLLSVLLLMSLPVVVFGQQEVTKFLGIPVDGSRSKMIRKLIKKGFKPSSLDRNTLMGEFNGENSFVSVMTNRNKVWRVCVIDVVGRDEHEIKVRFNQLCEEFFESGRYVTAREHVLASLTRNVKYVSTSDSPDNYMLSDDDDISHGISCNDTIYGVSFCQLPTKSDTTEVMKEVMTVFVDKYSVVQMSNPTEEVRAEMRAEAVKRLDEQTSMRAVWFRIHEIDGKYRIALYYDNKYNEASGEDL